MKKQLIKQLTEDFESYANFTENGIEFWFARDLQHLLGYTEWRNFTKVINKAKTACETAGHKISDHFVDVNKMVSIGSGAERPAEDIRKLERRVKSEDKKFIKNPERLDP